MKGSVAEVFGQKIRLLPQHVPQEHLTRQPMIKVSALKTCDILRFDAPSARKIPISLVRSITDMWVIIPIIMQETISDTPTKPTICISLFG